MRAPRPLIGILIFSFSLAFIPVQRARAATFADATITVAVGTVAGAVLGASTLPFYEESGKHTKNIFYGAALGAVVGVLVSAYAGVQGGNSGDEEAFLPARKPSQVSLNEAPELKLKAQPGFSHRPSAALLAGAPIFWSPLAQLRF